MNPTSQLPNRRSVSHPEASAGAPLPTRRVLLENGKTFRWQMSLGLALQGLAITTLILVPVLLPEKLNGSAVPPRVVLPPVQIGVWAGSPDGGSTGAGHQQPYESNRPPIPPIDSGVTIRFEGQQIPPEEPEWTRIGGHGEGEPGLGVPWGVQGGAPWVPNQMTPPLPQPSVPQPQGPIVVGGRVEPPRLLRRIEPDYPRLARQAHIEGTMVLEVVLGTDGRVETIATKSGHPLLARSALVAVEQWVYEPLLLNGQPVRAQMEVVVHFHLHR